MTKAKRADGEATRKRILQTAGELIAVNGFAGTPNKMVAAKAGADMASINYHFGNRNGLYQAVLVEAHRRIIDRADIERIASSKLPARDKLRMLIEFFVASGSGSDRWPVIVLFRELLAPGPHIEVLRDVEVVPKLLLVLPILGEITSLPPDDPALWSCLPCVGAPCLALLLVGRHLPFSKIMLDLPREELVEHLHTFAIGGLEAIGGRYRQKLIGRPEADPDYSVSG
ncbi:TetR/AcrR family transcriptional regulator [Paracoccus onubensis]|uniref:TetR/AcrR family transcriptional regulator n=1 Tax=Paracoccus onubensis TaxID=1675788 RepID=UPI00272FA7CC|nr:TetR/AcrR family transcriptional regulator [Paracoccus onubensis]MDP0928670.1 TetR/AcrR family transcriptional regulator [Paracoccus onubensis]